MRRGLILGIAFVLLLTVAWWFFLISPRNGKIDEARQAVAAAQDEEALLRTRVIQLEEIRNAEVEYLSAIGSLETLIPERPLLEEFIEQLTSLAETSTVGLKSLSPSLPAPAESESPLREIGVSVQIEGGFFEVLGFLFGLSDMDRLVRVDAVAISSSDVEGETVLAVSMQLTLFTLADLLPLPDDGTDLSGEGDLPDDSPFESDDAPEDDQPTDTAPEV
jgi:Tfp pilus assembly protein PilO